MEPLTGDRLDGFLEATEQANAISQPQAWNGIDGLLNGKPFMPEASPADRAAALIELAEKNAPRLGSEERQLIVAYAEAVGDTDKVIGLINRLCEQGYELQKGQMDSFVKSEIGSEIAVANAQRQIAQNPAAEPVVTILWSESPHLKDGQQMPLHEAEAVFKELDSARRHEREQPGYTGHWYDKTRFRIDFTMQGQPDSYEGRQDFGDGDGSLIQHIRGYHEYYAQDESWKNHVLHHEGPEAWEADKAQRDMLLHEFVVAPDMLDQGTVPVAKVLPSLVAVRLALHGKVNAEPGLVVPMARIARLLPFMASGTVQLLENGLGLMQRHLLSVFQMGTFAPKDRDNRLRCRILRDLPLGVGNGNLTSDLAFHKGIHLALLQLIALFAQAVDKPDYFVGIAHGLGIGHDQLPFLAAQTRGVFLCQFNQSGGSVSRGRLRHERLSIQKAVDPVPCLRLGNGVGLFGCFQKTVQPVAGQGFHCPSR
jgi:hypothetical protein